VYNRHDPSPTQLQLAPTTTFDIGSTPKLSFICN
jgi:hypothetical protein